jgi:MFS family permease
MIKGNNHARPRFCVVLLDVFDTAGIGYIAPSLITERGLEQPAPAPVLSAAFGLAAGALSSGPLADRSERVLSSAQFAKFTRYRRRKRAL